MFEKFSLKGKNAIVTGATRGIGLAIARGFLQSGANVTLCSRRQEGVNAALDALKEFDGRLQGLAVHIGNPKDLELLVQQSEEKFGAPHILINNAGTNPYFGPIVESEDWAWEKTMDVNLKGPYRLSRLVSKRMIDASGGSIVNIASIAGLSAAPLQGIYSVSKAGLIMLTKVMARELGQHNIRVNCICPGVIKTKLSEALWKDEETEMQFAKLKALGRVGTTDELVGAAIYLASDAGSFTTGAMIQVDGGMVI